MSFGDTSSRAWHLDADRAAPIVERAVEAGIILFDTADMYDRGESERVAGALLRRFFTRRDDYVLATKVYFPMGAGVNDRGLSRKHILSSIDASLERLGTDYVDLYQVHRWDDDTPVEETMRALDDVVRSGRARYIGASSMFAWQFAKAQATAGIDARTPFVSMQGHYNLVYREEEREMLPLCVDQQVGYLAYSPLARGLLSGSRDPRGEATTARARNDPLADAWFEEGDLDLVDAAREVACLHDVSPAQTAVAWLLSKEAVTAPIIGATKPAHIDDAVGAVGLRLTPDEIARLEAPYRPHRVLGHE